MATNGTMQKIGDNYVLEYEIPNSDFSVTKSQYTFCFSTRYAGAYYKWMYPGNIILRIKFKKPTISTVSGFSSNAVNYVSNNGGGVVLVSQSSLSGYMPKVKTSNKTTYEKTIRVDELKLYYNGVDYYEAAIQYNTSKKIIDVSETTYGEIKLTLTVTSANCPGYKNWASLQEFSGCSGYLPQGTYLAYAAPNSDYERTSTSRELTSLFSKASGSSSTSYTYIVLPGNGGKLWISRYPSDSNGAFVTEGNYFNLRQYSYQATIRTPGGIRYETRRCLALYINGSLAWETYNSSTSGYPTGHIVAVTDNSNCNVTYWKSY